MIRLFDLRNNCIFVGLYHYIEKFCKDREYLITADSWKPIANEMSAIEAKNYIESLNIHSKNKPIKAHDYQIVSFIYAVRDKRLLLESPTSSGKSFIQYTIFRYLTEQLGCKRGLLVVPTTSLVEQMYTDFEDYSSVNEFDVESNCHRVYAYKDMVKQTNKKLTITTWQSLYKESPEFLSQFDFILGDEAHTFKNKSLQTIMTNLKNCPYKISMTGSLDDTEVHKLTIEGLFGRYRKFVSTKNLMDANQVAQLEIKCLFLKHPDELAHKYAEASYADETEFLLANKVRNRFICNLAISLEGNTMILYQFVDKHGRLLYDEIVKKLSGTNRKVFFVWRGTEVDQREEIRRIVEQEKDAIIVASFGTFSTGINIKRLHNIILSHGNKSKIRILQSIGRGLRLGEGKVKMTLFDIIDDLQYGIKMNYSLDHFQKRLAYYIKEQFTYRFYNIKIGAE
jgi:superfamily II DNA or RNA helicase